MLRSESGDTALFTIGSRIYGASGLSTDEACHGSAPENEEGASA